jgi:hypothetical protein
MIQYSELTDIHLTYTQSGQNPTPGAMGMDIDMELNPENTHRHCMA